VDEMGRKLSKFQDQFGLFDRAKKKISLIRGHAVLQFPLHAMRSRQLRS
jgi:hypothetical protein